MSGRECRHGALPLSTVYVCVVDVGKSAARHLMIAPPIGDQEALCGQRVTESRPVSWDTAMQTVTCQECRRDAVRFRATV